MIHDRLKYLEEQQRQYWEQLQHMSSAEGPAVSAAREAAQAAIHKQCGSMRDDILKQVSRLAQETAANAAREASESAAREAASVARDAVKNAAQSIKDEVQQAQEQMLRSAVERVQQSCRQDMEQALRDAAGKIERACRQDMEELRANINQDQGNALRDAAENIQQACRRDMDELRANINRDAEQALRDAGEKIQQSCRQDVNGLREQMDRQDDDVAKIGKSCAAMQEDLSKIYKELDRLERVKLDRDEFFQQMKKHSDHVDASLQELRQQVDDDIKRKLANLKQPEPRKETPPPKKEPPPPPPPAPVAPEPSAAFKKAPKETYVILKATADDSVHYLCELENVLGRGSNCSAVVGQSQSISNQHASIIVSAKGAVIKDLGSRNGTWLDDHRVGPHEAVRIESGDAIQFGVDGPSYLFEWGPAAAKLLPREYQAVRSGGRDSAANLAKPLVENVGPSRSRTPVR